MSDLRIKHVGGRGGFPVDVKRFEAPFHVFSRCPHCDEEQEAEETLNYFSYPTLCIKEPVHFICDCGDTETEWKRYIVMTIKAVVAE